RRRDARRPRPSRGRAGRRRARRRRRAPPRTERPAARAARGGAGIRRPVVSCLGMAAKKPRNVQAALRMGEAAELAGVSVDTIRRWAEDGTLRTTRSTGGQRLVSVAEVRRLVGARRKAAPARTIVAQSARTRFPGVVT